MRPPRYRFPDEIRSTTRTIASRMVREGEVAGTPEELDRWIAREADIRASLDRGGFGTKFTSEDLLPLLHVFVAQIDGAPPVAEPAAPPGTRVWVWAVLAVVAVGVLVLLFIAGN